MNAIAEAKQCLPLPALLHREGLGDHAKKSARCPFHDDTRNSFSVYKNGNGDFRWKCFAGCGEGDEINFIELHESLSRKAATKRFLEMAGVNGATPRSTSTLDWAKCVDAFAERHIEGLARWRGYCDEFVNWLKENGLVGIYDGRVATPVIQNGAVFGAHYRLKDGTWRYFPHGMRTLPLVVGELVPGDDVHLFESIWDGFDFLDKSGYRSGVIITRGANNAKLAAALIPQNSSVFCWTQNDAAGAKWEKDLCANTKATVRRVKIPAEFKDLNVWTRGGATVDDLIAAIGSAETLREREKSWDEALNESVIASSDLRNLKLMRRKKLLADWFAEGDCGFIFAPRGVGKTWFALAIARALSIGGKLGEWKANEAVKVLYVDGEMPADLMRERIEGLDGSNGNFRFLNHEILFDRTGKVLNVANREVQQAITKCCVATGVKVLFLDNLSTLASGIKENEADSWEQVNGWLLDLRRRKIAVVIVHHAGRSGEMRGTSKREDSVFWIIALDDAKKNAEDKRGARFVSRFTKPSRNTQEEVPAFEWHFITEPNGEISISHKLAQTMDVFLGLVGDGVNDCAAIAEEMKISKASVSRMAKRAEGGGKIIIKSRRYFLEEGAKNDAKKS